MIAPRRRRRFRIHPRTLRLWGVLLVLAAIAGAYVLIASIRQAAGAKFLIPSDFMPSRAVDVVVFSWFFFVGSSIGSFLNVVAWRMPRGRSIQGRSHCPFCNSELTWRENFPIFGWIVLGGRCRNCRMPISPRYPVVELLVALTVSAIAVSGLFRDATHLPFWPKQFGQTTPLAIPHLSYDSLAVIIHHIVGLACVWAFALVRYDSQPLPRSLVNWSLALVTLPILAYPALAVVPWSLTAPEDWSAAGRYGNAALRVLTGIAIGSVLPKLVGGGLVGGERIETPPADGNPSPHDVIEGSLPSDHTPIDSGKRRDLTLMMILVAILVGWQGAIGVATITTLLTLLIPPRWTGRGDALARFAIVLPFVVAMQLSLWRLLEGLNLYPGIDTPLWVMPVWVAAILVLSRGIETDMSLLIEPAGLESNDAVAANPVETIVVQTSIVETNIVETNIARESFVEGDTFRTSPDRASGPFPDRAEPG